jgi:hypothetical protein
MISLCTSVLYYFSSPLDTGQDGGDVVSRTPSVLKNVQAELSGGVNVGVKHLADELDLRRLVWVLFLELHHQSKGAVFEWGVSGADNHGVPGHDIVWYRRCRNTSWGIGLHALEVSHETAASGGRHDDG